MAWWLVEWWKGQITKGGQWSFYQAFFGLNIFMVLSYSFENTIVDVYSPDAATLISSGCAGVAAVITLIGSQLIRSNPHRLSRSMIYQGVVWIVLPAVMVVGQRASLWVLIGASASGMLCWASWRRPSRRKSDSVRLSHSEAAKYGLGEEDYVSPMLAEADEERGVTPTNAVGTTSSNLTSMDEMPIQTASNPHSEIELRNNRVDSDSRRNHKSEKTSRTFSNSSNSFSNSSNSSSNSSSSPNSSSSHLLTFSGWTKGEVANKAWDIESTFLLAVAAGHLSSALHLVSQPLIYLGATLMLFLWLNAPALFPPNIFASLGLFASLRLLQALLAYNFDLLLSSLFLHARLAHLGSMFEWDFWSPLLSHLFLFASLPLTLLGFPKDLLSHLLDSDRYWIHLWRATFLSFFLSFFLSIYYWIFTLIPLLKQFS